MRRLEHIDTTLIHGGIDGDVHTGAVNVPIYQTSTYRQAALGVNKGYEYSRTGNPTREALEKLISQLEGGSAGFAFASGMAAISGVLNLFNSGDKVLISSNVYGGTFRVLDQIYSRFQLSYEIVDTTDLEAVRKSMGADVKAILVESPANPLLTVTDIKKIAQLAKEKGVLTIVDNTFMTPYLQKPLELGADIVVHSATKYLGGHSDLIAGLAVVKDAGLAEQMYFIQNATGGILQPFDSFLLIRGIKTLGVRMDRHVENALFTAEFLKENEAVSKVYYPGLKTDPGYEINSVQASAGGGMLTFELKKEYDPIKFFSSIKLIALAESLGGVESLVCHPASMTHASIPKEIREKVGITDGLIRLSLGIEHKEDITEDIQAAINRSRRL